MSEGPERNPYPRRRWIEYGALPVAVVFWVAVVALGPRPRRRHYQRSRCMSNLKQIGYACQLFSGDNREAFPADLGELYPDYISYPGIFICPVSRAPVRECRASYPGAIAGANLSYCYVSGLTAADPPHYVLAFEEEWNHEGEGLHYMCIGGQCGWARDIQRFHANLGKQIAELEANGRTPEVVRPSWSTWPAKPPWIARSRSRLVWIGVGAGVGAVLLAGVVTLIVFRRRRRASRAPVRSAAILKK